MHVFLAAADSREALRRELTSALPGPSSELRPGLFACDIVGDPPLPRLAFARQILPRAQAVEAASIRAFANHVVDAVLGFLPEHAPWALHVVPFRQVSENTRMGARAWHSQARSRKPPQEDVAKAPLGYNRSRLIRESVVELLRKRRRHLARHLREGVGPFWEDEALVQLVLTTPETGFLSIALAPSPFLERHVLSCFPAGEVARAVDKQAPSRAFAKLCEAEARLGRRIGARETCVDLGASPGSWTYVAARRGAKVTAVDRAELRADLMQQRSVHFERGDAFRFRPGEPVDWLLCDVIAAPERTAELLLRWLSEGWCRNFVVTLKVDDEGSLPVLAELERELPAVTSEFWLIRLCANKKEVCAFGTRGL